MRSLTGDGGAGRVLLRNPPGRAGAAMAGTARAAYRCCACGLG
jgi:hypothetical protein